MDRKWLPRPLLLLALVTWPPFNDEGRARSRNSHQRACWWSQNSLQKLFYCMEFVPTKVLAQKSGKCWCPIWRTYAISCSCVENRNHANMWIVSFPLGKIQNTKDKKQILILIRRGKKKNFERAWTLPNNEVLREIFIVWRRGEFVCSKTIFSIKAQRSSK